MEEIRITKDDLVEQGKGLCRDYVHDRLKRDGITTKKIPTPSTFSDTSIELQKLGREIERRHPELYQNISRQLNMTFKNEDMCCKTFSSVGEHILKNGVTWGKIVSLFALAGSFAEDCVRQGHADYIPILLETFGRFIDSNLAEWLLNNGGWVSIITCCRSPKVKNIKLIVAVVGFILGFLVIFWMIYKF